jgi:hypothetical protein
VKDEAGKSNLRHSKKAEESEGRQTDDGSQSVPQIPQV